MIAAMVASDAGEAGSGLILRMFWAETSGLLAMLMSLIRLKNLAAVLTAIVFVHLAAHWEREHREG